ncbi:glycosyltransferase family 4 protein [Sulfitobacter geojensis]|uniref:glycosyltransferase family 4 protein n=1 Tax=Sulfitobacter geojensis TaxID=1342299 RepID=UPI0004684CEC|nr:glycosyltransferase family 4 protein [Sulfitobacter geojensis]KHA50142.1 Glycosyltransferase [Sulfitobacter geojensis]NYI27463.1 glycosyltransferase involved in cell wall biosynthesis [Sulfitobacter geojensis]
MKTITFIANAPSPNTTEIYRTLNARSDLDVHVIYIQRENPKWKDSISTKGYKTTFLAAGASYSANIRSVFLSLKRQNSDFVILQGYTDAYRLIALVGLAFFSAIPWFFWAERLKKSNADSWFKNAAKKIVIQCVMRAHKILPVGKAGLESFHDWGVPRSRMISIPYARDLSVYTQVHPKTDKDGIGIVCTARLLPLKRVDILIDAFRALAENNQSLTLHLIGDGPLRDALRKKIPAEIEAQVIFHGYLNPKEQVDVYNLSDIFVLPSEHDGWGMVVLEAMAAGLPVITTEGVISSYELVRDTRAGYVIPTSDEVRLRKNLTTLIEDKQLREEMANRARDTAGQYSLKNVVDQLNSVLTEIE